MRAVHGEHLEPLTLDVPHPAGDLRRRAVPRDAAWILVRRQARLARGESADGTERDPRLPVGASAGRPEDVSDDWNTDQGGAEHVQRDAEPEQESSARLRAWRHGSLPGAGRRCATSQATTSETCCGVSGAAAPSSRQSGMPRSERPAMTVVLRCWSLTSARYDGSVTLPPFGVPRPSSPWHRAHAVAKTARPRSIFPALPPDAGLSV